MALTLATVAAAMTAAVDVVDATRPLFTRAAEMMVTLENVFTGAADAGASKKALLLKFLETLAGKLGIDWSGISKMIAAWIDTVKRAFNDLLDASTTIAAA